MRPAVGGGGVTRRDAEAGDNVGAFTGARVFEDVSAGNLQGVCVSWNVRYQAKFFTRYLCIFFAMIH